MEPNLVDKATFSCLSWSTRAAELGPTSHCKHGRWVSVSAVLQPGILDFSPYIHQMGDYHGLGAVGKVSAAFINSIAERPSDWPRLHQWSPWSPIPRLSRGTTDRILLGGAQRHSLREMSKVY